MKKIFSIAILAVIAFFVLFVCYASLTQAQENEQEQEKSADPASIKVTRTIYMKPPAEMKAKQGPVTWPHLAHAMQFGCSDCHHKWQPEKEAVPQKCFACHNNDSQPENPNFFRTFHDRRSGKSCLGCHTTLKKENPETSVPLACTKCHVKPESE